MARNGLEGARKTERGGRRKEPCGEEDTHKALMITLFFVAPQEKLKSAGRKILFCKNTKIPMASIGNSRLGGIWRSVRHCILLIYSVVLK